MTREIVYYKWDFTLKATGKWTNVDPVSKSNLRLEIRDINLTSVSGILCYTSAAFDCLPAPVSISGKLFDLPSPPN
jgi:hypothetical protein